jgi:putative transposase
LGFVVMPEHVHRFISERRMSNPSSVLQVLKEQVSRVLQKDLPSQELEKFAAAQQQQQLFWQRRFYDFNVWSENKVREKLHYMRANPVSGIWFSIRRTGHAAVGPTTQGANQD